MRLFVIIFKLLDLPAVGIRRGIRSMYTHVAIRRDEVLIYSIRRFRCTMNILPCDYLSLYLIHVANSCSGQWVLMLNYSDLKFALVEHYRQDNS